MRLKELRIASGFTQQDIADELSCSITAYSRYERGIRGIDYSTLLKLSELFKVSIDYILENDKFAIEKQSEKFLNSTDGLILKQYHKAVQFDQVAILRILVIKEKVGTENLIAAK